VQAAWLCDKPCGAAIPRLVLPAASRGRTLTSSICTGWQISSQAARPACACARARARTVHRGSHTAAGAQSDPDQGPARAAPLPRSATRGSRARPRDRSCDPGWCQRPGPPGGQLGWHVQHPLPVGQRPLHQRTADPVRPFHRPDPLGPLPGEPEQLPVAAGIGAKSAAGPQDLPAAPWPQS
jgi:hypothetical protein